MKLPLRLISLVGATGLMLFSQTDVLAHPGHLGAITHLGPKTIALSIAAAAIDSFNPTALGVLLLLMKSYQRISQSALGILRIGLLYIAGIVLMYLLAGYGINQLLYQAGPSVVTEGLQILLAFLLFTVGIRELASVFHKENWFPWADKLVDFLLRIIKPVTSNIWPFFLGIVFGFIELFLTGAIYLSFIRGITYDPTVHAGVLAAFMGIYLFVFVLPLLVAVYFVGISGALAGAVRKDSKLALAFRGAIGVIFIAVATWLTVVSVNLLRTFS